MFQSALLGCICVSPRSRDRESRRSWENTPSVQSEPVYYNSQEGDIDVSSLELEAPEVGNTLLGEVHDGAVCYESDLDEPMSSLESLHASARRKRRSSRGGSISSCKSSVTGATERKHSFTDTERAEGLVPRDRKRSGSGSVSGASTAAAVVRERKGSNSSNHRGERYRGSHRESFSSTIENTGNAVMDSILTNVAHVASITATAATAVATAATEAATAATEASLTHRRQSEPAEDTLSSATWSMSSCSTRSVENLENEELEMPVAMVGKDMLLPPMPRRFLVSEGGDLAKAVERYKKTLKWREQRKLDDVLDRPHPLFHLCKEHYPQWYHLADKHGGTVYIEKPGRIGWAALKQGGTDREGLLAHYLYQMEFIWQRWHTLQRDALTIILDLEGLKGALSVRGDVLWLLKETIRTMGTYYPGRARKLFIVNPPSSFSTIYGVIKSLLRERARNRLSVLGPDLMKEALLEEIDAENLPPCYGGTCTLPLGQAPVELALRKHVEAGLPTT